MTCLRRWQRRVLRGLQRRVRCTGGGAAEERVGGRQRCLQPEADVSGQSWPPRTSREVRESPGVWAQSWLSSKGYAGGTALRDPPNHFYGGSPQSPKYVGWKEMDRQGFRRGRQIKSFHDDWGMATLITKHSRRPWVKHCSEPKGGTVSWRCHGAKASREAQRRSLQLWWGAEAAEDSETVGRCFLTHSWWDGSRAARPQRHRDCVFQKT